MRWDGWVDLYPGTRVWGSPTDRRRYDINPYVGYDAPNSEFTFPMPPISSSLPLKEVVLGVGGKGAAAWAFPFQHARGARSDGDDWAFYRRNPGGIDVGPQPWGGVGIQP